MDLSQYLKVLHKRWILVTSCVVAGIAVATAVILSSTPIYQAKVKLFVAASDAQSSVSQALSGSQFSQQRVKSYADIIASKQVVAAVKQSLGLSDPVSALQGEISAAAPLDTVLVNVSVTERSAARAQAIANEVGKQFALFINDLETPPGQRVSSVKVSVVEPADLPSAPVSPKKKLDLALGLLVGLAMGVGGAVLRETLDTTVKSPEDVQEITDAITLGVIYFDPDARETPLVVEANPHSVRAEAFRQLRTNLQFVDVERPARSIVVTSSLSREGKTTTTINLALAMVRAGRSVCLIEGDLRGPRVARYVNVPEDLAGLTDVLIGAARLDDVLIRYKESGMVMLPSGAQPPNPSELLGSAAMRSLMGELTDRFDVVVVDSPPLLPVTDAAVLATVCDGVVLLARAGRTRREQLTRAVEALRAVDGRILGTVLNMVPSRGRDAYGYAYGYGHAYGHGDSERGFRFFRGRRNASDALAPPIRPMADSDVADRAVASEFRVGAHGDDPSALARLRAMSKGSHRLKN